MKIWSMVLCILVLLAADVYAAQSTIVEASGSACMGDELSRKQTEQAALTDAKKKAVEHVSTYVKGETKVKNFELEKDVVAAYMNAQVKVLEELDKTWYKDPDAGECLRMKIRAEVLPDPVAMESLSRDRLSDDPSAPLKVSVWTDKKQYREGEKITIYLKANKPFYARVVYQDASGETLQLLPNPFRQDNYFNGGAVYEIPAGNDRFELEVSPPFGEEKVMVYASSAPLGDIGVVTRGGVYRVRTGAGDIGIKTRGVKLVERKEGPSSARPAAAAEFSEDQLVIRTEK